MRPRNIHSTGSAASASSPKDGLAAYRLASSSIDLVRNGTPSRTRFLPLLQGSPHATDSVLQQVETSVQNRGHQITVIKLKP